jgi:hypothetical protein
MQEQIADVIAQLEALLAKDGLDAATASELRYRARQLELAAAQLQRGDDREEAYGLLCDALLALARDGILAQTQLPPWAAPRPVPLTPELLEWARRELNEEEIVEGLREIRQTGGLELKDFLPELERAAGADE